MLSTKNLKLDIKELCLYWINDGPWYSPEIQPQWHGYTSENLFNRGRNDIYDLMCAISEYDKQNPPSEPENTISDGGRTLTSTLPKNSFASLGSKLNFNDQWLQFFETNCSTITSFYRNKI